MKESVLFFLLEVHFLVYKVYDKVYEWLKGMDINYETYAFNNIMLYRKG